MTRVLQSDDEATRSASSCRVNLEEEGMESARGARRADGGSKKARNDEPAVIPWLDVLDARASRLAGRRGRCRRRAQRTGIHLFLTARAEAR